MVFSYNWLKEYFEDDLPKPQDLVELLLTHSFEIENLEAKGDDYEIDIDILPNRAHDALCHYGMAREIAVITGLNLKEIKTQPNQNLEVGKIKVTISNEACRRYIAQEVKNVKVGPSPIELRKKLEAIGQRSINNIVDITNIVMFELNQPMHAFDADKLDGDILVRLAKDGETIETLDKQKIELTPQYLLIADQKDPLAIAGVKGGSKAEVDEKTTNIILESANFDPVSVRKTSQKTTVKTESSKRFENGLSPELAKIAIDLATEMIKKYASTSQTIFHQQIDEYPTKAKSAEIKITTEKVNSLLGSKLSTAEIAKILEKLKFQYKNSGDNFEIEIPIERLDLTISEDVIEEIGRLYGYNNIKDQEITNLDFKPQINVEYGVNAFIRKILTELGFSEVMTYSFIANGVLAPEKPIAEDKKYLRQSLKERINDSLILNQRNADWLGLDQIKIFEIGKVFDGKPNHYFEKAHLGLGVLNKLGFKKPKAGSVLKEAIAKISTELGIEIKVKINEDQDTFVEIDLEEIYPKINSEKVLGFQYCHFSPAKNNLYNPISTYPFVLRDIAVWLPNQEDPKNLVKILKEKSGDLLVKEPRQFDVYEKDNQTSYAYRLVFQSYDKTLTDDEINQIMDDIAKEIKKRSWEIR